MQANILGIHLTVLTADSSETNKCSVIEEKSAMNSKNEWNPMMATLPKIMLTNNSTIGQQGFVHLNNINCAPSALYGGAMPVYKNQLCYQNQAMSASSASSSIVSSSTVQSMAQDRMHNINLPEINATYSGSKRHRDENGQSFQLPAPKSVLH